MCSNLFQLNRSMQYLNTRDSSESVSFMEATINGLGRNGGLYVPDNIPTLRPDFFEKIENLSDVEIASTALLPFVEDSLTHNELLQILSQTLSFPIPVKHVDNDVYVLELFHGPTKAFKDVGARFMSRCLSKFVEYGTETIVLVATSGDTGSAVANGFSGVEGIRVKVLFPKGKVSPYQEYQMTSLGGNIQALEVNGTFDDCQSLVKQAFSDRKLNQQVQLSSANSINVARFLPQMVYYFFAYKQLKGILSGRSLVVSVPSGNFGNLTAGLIAKKMGLPIARFVAANNANRTFFNYLNTGEYTPQKSVSTISNAMDVGAPSNFERIAYLYNNELSSIQKDVSGFSFSDEATLEEIRRIHMSTDYILDPHGAVGHAGLMEHLGNNEVGVFLETAHPRKFESVMKKAIPTYPIKYVSFKDCSKRSMTNSYEELVELILGS